MKEHKITVLIVCLAFVLMGVYVFTFQVHTTQMAVHYRPPGNVHRVINRPDAEENEAGLYFRLPFPADQVQHFDHRVRVIDGPLSQTQLQDEWQVIVSISAPWRIADPVPFVQNLGGSVEVAERNLRDIIYSETSNAISDMRFRNLVSTNEEDLKFDELEKRIREGTRASIRDEEYGLELLDFGIRRIAIPDTTTEEIFERMRAEREREAQTYISEGETRKQEIIAEAEREAQNIRANAAAEAKRIESEGEAIEAEFYEDFARAPELAIYLRRLESLRNIAEQAKEHGRPISFVLDTHSQPLSVLYSGPLGTFGGFDDMPQMDEVDIEDELEGLEETLSGDEDEEAEEPKQQLPEDETEVEE